MSLALGTAVDALAGEIAAVFHSHVGWRRWWSEGLGGVGYRWMDECEVHTRGGRALCKGRVKEMQESEWEEVTVTQVECPLYGRRPRLI